MRSRWGFCRCCPELQDRPRKLLEVQPETLVPPSQLHAEECFLFPGEANLCELRGLPEGKETKASRVGETYGVKKVSLRSEGQQPQASLQIPCPDA